MAKPTDSSAQPGRSPWANTMILVLIVALVGTGVWFTLGSSPSDESTPAEPGLTTVSPSATPASAAPEVGRAAPALDAHTIGGEKFSLGKHRGRPVWVVFNATWCSACRSEAPDVEALAKRGGVDVVAVFMGEEGATVSDFLTRVGMTTPIAIADPDQRLSANWGVVGLPAHVFIDADGIVRDIRTGQLSRAIAADILASLRPASS